VLCDFQITKTYPPSHETQLPHGRPGDAHRRGELAGDEHPLPLMPNIKESFQPTGFAAGLTAFAFFITYGVMSIPAGELTSVLFGNCELKDPVGCLERLLRIARDSEIQ